VSVLRGVWEQLRAYYASRSRTDQRVLLGLGVVTLLSVLYLLVWVPVRDYREQVVAEIDQGQQDVERSARFLGSIDALRAERDGLKKKLAAAKQQLLPGDSGTLGAAALQERANAAALEKGVSVQSTQVMKEEAVDPFRRVAIRMTLSSELKPLAELISTLEYTNHLVLPFVEISRRGAVAAGAKGPRTLQATVEVAGFVLSGVAKDADAAEAPAEGAGPPGDPTAVPEGGAPPAETGTVAPAPTVPASLPAAGAATTTTATAAAAPTTTASLPPGKPPTAPPPAAGSPAATPPKPGPAPSGPPPAPPGKR
jgi:type II secretory pathway component PulM